MTCFYSSAAFEGFAESKASKFEVFDCVDSSESEDVFGRTIINISVFKSSSPVIIIIFVNICVEYINALAI